MQRSAGAPGFGIVRLRPLFTHDGPTERVDLTGRLIKGNPGPQAADGAKMMTPRPSLRHVVLQRRPELRGGSQHVLERSRHDPDDDVAVIIEGDGATDDCSIGAEAPPPEVIAEDDHVRPAESIV